MFPISTLKTVCYTDSCCQWNQTTFPNMWEFSHEKGEKVCLNRNNLFVLHFNISPVSSTINFFISWANFFLNISIRGYSSGGVVLSCSSCMVHWEGISACLRKSQCAGIAHISCPAASPLAHIQMWQWQLMGNRI